VLALVRSGNGDELAGGASVVLSIVAVVLSWCPVNTVFALKYARLYYVDEDGGIDFRQDEPPAYTNVAYLAFPVGTFAVATPNRPTKAQIARRRSPPSRCEVPSA
jgi:uncharacterized membrane protein